MPEACVHHWLLDERRPMAGGRCCRCGAAREFLAVFDEEFIAPQATTNAYELKIKGRAARLHAKASVRRGAGRGAAANAAKAARLG